MAEKSEIITEKEEDLSLIIKENKTPNYTFGGIMSALFKSIIIALSAVAVALFLGSAFLANNYYMGAWLGIFLFAIMLNNFKKLSLSLLYCFVVGFTFNLILLYWIYPTVLFGTQDSSLSFLSVFSLSALMSLQFILFGLFYFYLKNLTWVLPLAASCLWVSLEFVHQLIAFHLFAFPWFVLGYSQFENLPLIQISSVTGVYGVSFIIVFIGFAMSVLFGAYKKRQKTIVFFFALLILVFVLLYGKNEINKQREFLNTSPKQIKVALMQPNTHGLILFDRGVEAYSVLSHQLISLEGKDIDLIIWPETSLEGTFTSDINRNFLQSISKYYQTPQIFGGAEVKNNKLYVGVGLFDETGLIDSYQKNKLVPFGEFLPFQSLLGNFYRNKNITSFTGDFSEGENLDKVLVLQSKGKAFPFGANICFESLFPKIWRSQAKAGAQFFVNVSNDGWFLETAAPLQHLRINVFRAVENRRPILRATTTGYNAWIDSLGEIRFRSNNLFKQETAIFDFKFQTRSKKTFYTVYGDIFALICVFLTVSFWGVAIAFYIQDNYGE